MKNISTVDSFDQTNNIVPNAVTLATETNFRTPNDTVLIAIKIGEQTINVPATQLKAAVENCCNIHKL